MRNPKDKYRRRRDVADAIGVAMLWAAIIIAGAEPPSAVTIIIAIALACGAVAILRLTEAMDL